jgi:hypothetical protein
MAGPSCPTHQPRAHGGVDNRAPANPPVGYAPPPGDPATVAAVAAVRAAQWGPARPVGPAAGDVDGGRGAVRHRGRPGRGRPSRPGEHRPAGGGRVPARDRADAGRHRGALDPADARVPRGPAAGAGQRPSGRHQVVTQEPAGPPVGGFLFSAAAWIPFAVDADDGRHGRRRQPPGRGRRRRDGAVRPGEAGAGRRRRRAVLLGGSAVGGVLGSLVAARVVRGVGPARIAIWTMVGSALGFLVFGLSSDPWLAGAMFGPVGFLTVIFNVVLGSLGQASPPTACSAGDQRLPAVRLRRGAPRLPPRRHPGPVVRPALPVRVAGVVIPVVALACLPAINTAPSPRPAPRPGSSRVLGRHELRRRRRYIRSGASTPIRSRVLARTWRVALTSHQRALDRAWSSLRTRHSA